MPGNAASVDAGLRYRPEMPMLSGWIRVVTTSALTTDVVSCMLAP
jgi:hypothetical protein